MLDGCLVSILEMEAGFMEQKMYNVTIQGETKQYPEGISYGDIVKEYEHSSRNVRLWSLVILLMKSETFESL